MEYELECRECNRHFPPEDIIVRYESGCYESDYGVYSEFNTHNYYEIEKHCCPNCGCADNFKDVCICNECYNAKDECEIIDIINMVCEDCMRNYTKEIYFKKYPKNDVGDWYE